MTPADSMRRIDDLLSHVWMVRTFLKHSDEAQDDEELNEIFRGLYDYMLALGEPFKQNDAPGYLRQARKKLAKLREATDRFVEAQPDISAHTNFQMAARSLSTAVREIGDILESGGGQGE